MAYSEDKEPTGLTAKTTPVDADVVVIGDSADANEVAKKTTWANIKATLKTYNDTLYAAVLGADDNYVTDAEKTKLSNLSGTNSGDQTSIVGITGTKAQFDTAVTDGNFMYTGDAPTSHVHALSEITDSTSEALGVGTLEVGHASDTTLSRVSAGVVAVEGGTVPTISSTNTLTNKRVTLRTGTTTSHATPTINTDNVDFYSLTAQTEAITSFTTNLSGTPTEGQKLWIAVTGTAARAITWGASFENGPVALPTTTVTTTRLDVGFIWNTVTSKWRCVASGSTV